MSQVKNNVLYETSGFVRVLSILFLSLAMYLIFNGAHTTRQFIFGSVLMIFLFVIATSTWKKIFIENNRVIFYYFLFPFHKRIYPIENIAELNIFYRHGRDAFHSKKTNSFFIIIQEKNKSETKIKLLADAVIHKAVIEHFLEVIKAHEIPGSCYYD